MAAWQFALVLVPKAWFEKSGNRVDALLYDDGYETYQAWRDYQPKIDLDRLCGSLLPAAPSWSEEIKKWGSEKQTDVQVGYEDGLVESIRIRINVRENSMALLSKIVEVAKALDCLFFLPEEKAVIEPNIFELNTAILRSRAARFLKDPEGYLKGLTDL